MLTNSICNSIDLAYQRCISVDFEGLRSLPATKGIRVKVKVQH